MARALSIAVLLVLFALAAPAAAQDEAEPPARRVHVVRPPEGSMRRGVLPAPEWAFYACGGWMLAAAAGVLVWRSVTRRR